MKRFTFIITILFFFQHSMAQNLDVNSLPEIDDSRIINQVNQLTSFDVGPLGLGVEWDFSQLSFDSIIELSFAYMDSDTVDIEEYFPEATIAYVNQNFLMNRDYYVSSGNWFFRLGGSFGDNGHVRFNPGVREFLFPMEYQNSLTSQGETIFFFPDDTITNYYLIERTFDGVGTLKTAAGEFENCIRIKESYKSSAIPVFDNAIETVRHHWFYGKISNNMASVAEIVDADNFSYRWQENVNDLVSSNDNILEAEISIDYLRNGQFKIEAPKGIYAGELYAIDGKKIATKQFSILGESETIALSFDHEDTGQIYFLILWEKESGSFKVKKFNW